MSRLILVSLLVLCAASALAQAPYLVKDFGTGSTAPQSSHPMGFFATGDKLFFFAGVDYAGRELWVSDANGTRLVRDIRSGLESVNIPWMTELTPGTIVFGVLDETSDTVDLWRSDGTEEGTTRFLDLDAARLGFWLFPAALPGKVFFRYNDGVHGLEPWVTDGTEAGTQLLADTNPGSAGGGSNYWMQFKGAMRFFTGAGLWTTDGTPGGTSLTVPIPLPTLVVPNGNTLFFLASDFNGQELWKSDGTVAGTSLVKDTRPGSESYYIGSMAAAGTGVVFTAHSGNTGQLWSSDGTAENTAPLAAVPALTSSERTLALVATPAGTFWYRGGKLWCTDGTAANTRSLFDAGSVHGLISAFSKLYFVHWPPGAPGYALWTSDGTVAGTRSVVTGTIVNSVVPTGGKIYFGGADSRGNEPWVMDDADGASTRFIANVAPEPARSSSPQNLRAVGPHLYFHLAMPSELWRSDGTSAGTYEVTDLNSTETGSAGFRLAAYQGNIYYTDGWRKIYRFSGAATGAVVPELSRPSFTVSMLAADQRYLYIQESGPLLRSDGTEAGTIVLHDPAEPTQPSGPLWTAFDAGRLWVHNEKSLFRTEGTIETTRRVLTLPGSDHFGPYLATMGGRLYAGVSGGRLWQSDGTAEGSVFLATHGGYYVEELVSTGDLLFFRVENATSLELWRTDGTVDGTFRLKMLGPASANLTPSRAVNGTLYFTAHDAIYGVELWKSDGTETGTVLVEDIVPGMGSSNPQDFAVAAGKLWFTATDGLYGYELWTSDGTGGGTQLVSDVATGSASSLPQELTPAEGTLFFTAATPELGRELWALPLATAAFSIGDVRKIEGNAGTSTVRFTVTRTPPATAPASVTFATADGTATAGSDYDAEGGVLDFAAGETVKTFDVVVRGDAAVELSEGFFVRLSAPTGAVIGRGVAAATIENDDAVADLAIETVQAFGMRTFRVTNHGPSTATNVQVRFSESPYDLTFSASSAVVCTGGNPAQCNVPTLEVGASRTFSVRSVTTKGAVDPANPPGRTVTASVSGAAADPDLSNNITATMQTPDGELLLPPYLELGPAATARYLLAAPNLSAVDVTLTSTFGVTVTPSTRRIDGGQSGPAIFSLGIDGGVSSVLLQATPTHGSAVSMVVPVVGVGLLPKLDVAIVATHQPTYEYGETILIATKIAARRHDGTLPTGTVSLLDASGNVLTQGTVGGDAAATLVRQGLEPGSYAWRLRYDGDGNFQPLTVDVPAISVTKILPVVAILTPSYSCAETFEVPVTVTAKGSLVPVGSVAIFHGGTLLGRAALAPSGVAGQTAASPTITLRQAVNSGIVARYEPQGNFLQAEATKIVSTGAQQMNLAAIATSPTSVSLTWNAVQGATAYDVTRGSSLTSMQLLATVPAATLSFVDSVEVNRMYVYRIVPRASFGMLASVPDIANTYAWADHPLGAGMRLRAVHLLQLRAAVSALRTAAGLPPMTFTGTIAPGVAASARHVSELREAVDAARARICLSPVPWTHPAPTPGSFITAGPLQELRTAMQ